MYVEKLGVSMHYTKPQSRDSTFYPSSTQQTQCIPFAVFTASQYEDQGTANRGIPSSSEGGRQVYTSSRAIVANSFIQTSLQLSSCGSLSPDRLENNEPSHGAPGLKKNLMRYIALLCLSFHHHPPQYPPLAFLSASFKSLPRKDFGGHENGNCTMRRKRGVAV